MSSTSDSSFDEIHYSDDSLMDDCSDDDYEANLIPSTSATSVQKSFRGEDTRKTFVDHLYKALDDKGIITYKDDEKIQKGERIDEQLIRSMEESRFYIIVFSKNYASSSWCLHELVKIMECQKTMEQTAYPVFFDVEPTEVRNQSGAVGEAFAKQAEKEDAKRWRDALKEAAGLAGWELKNTVDGHEAKFIQIIVKYISLKAHFISSCIDGKLVGMETRVKDLVSSLEIDYFDVRTSKLSKLYMGLTLQLETLDLGNCNDHAELHMPVECPKLKSLVLSGSKLSKLYMGLTPQLETLDLGNCNDLVELHMPVVCPKLNSLILTGSKVRNLNLGMTPHLEKLDLKESFQLQEIDAPVGCLKNLVYLNLSGCLRFKNFCVDKRKYSFVDKQHKSAGLDSVATLVLTTESLDICPLHPYSSLPKFRFKCDYYEPLPSSSGNLEKLLSFGLCACTNYESFSASICGLQQIRVLTLDGGIAEVPKDLGLLENLATLTLLMEEIKHLPDSICMLKHLKYLGLKSCWLLEKLPKDLDRLECLCWRFPMVIKSEQEHKSFANGRSATSFSVY